MIGLKSRDAKIEQEVNTAKPKTLEEKILAYPDEIFIGYDDYRDKFFVLPSDSRVHTLIMGETGSGKSETLKLLMYQNILRDEGFMLIDPHGMLAKEVNELCKRTISNYDDKVIYIDIEHSDAKINPMEVKDVDREHIMLISFINALKNLYDYSWGDRLETILRNALLLIMTADPPCTLSKLAKALMDIKYRGSLIKGCGSREMQDFWYGVFPNYARDAFTAVYNKLDKLLSIASVRSIFDCEESTIDIGELVKQNKIVIISLASVIADDIIRFLGSLFIHILYVNAKSGVALDNKYYLYIDEAQLISKFAIREVLNAFRKFNISITLATQTINAFDKDVQKEIPALCRTIMLFRCDMDTAEQFAYLFSVSKENIYSLPLHYFYFYQQGERAIKGLAKSYVIK